MYTVLLGAASPAHSLPYSLSNANEFTVGPLCRLLLAAHCGSKWLKSATNKIAVYKLFQPIHNKAVLSVRKQGHFGSPKYNNIGTFEPKRPSGNCKVKCTLTDRTALIRNSSVLVIKCSSYKKICQFVAGTSMIDQFHDFFPILFLAGFCHVA